MVFNILTLERAIGYIANSHTTLALFFGVMVMIQALQPTQVFEYLATQMVILARGKWASRTSTRRRGSSSS